MPEDNGLMYHVLDKGFVRLVDCMGSDVSIARAARVSYNAAWRAGEDEESDHKLINYLWKNKHTSPFEAVTLTFEVKAPIFVFRQWHRHRTQSYNELSARYRAGFDEYYIPDPAIIGQQASANKQGREYSNVDRTIQLRYYMKVCDEAFEVYRKLLDEGWPRELARCVLPVSTYSHMFATMNLLNLFRFLTLRCDEHAQWEIRQYANAMVKLAHKVAPVAVKAWEQFKV